MVLAVEFSFTCFLWWSLRFRHIFHSYDAVIAHLLWFITNNLPFIINIASVILIFFRSEKFYNMMLLGGWKKTMFTQSSGQSVHTLHIEIICRQWAMFYGLSDFSNIKELILNSALHSKTIKAQFKWRWMVDKALEAGRNIST